MFPTQTQSSVSLLTTLPSIFPLKSTKSSIFFSKTQFLAKPIFKCLVTKPTKCSVASVSAVSATEAPVKPEAAEVARTIMELSSVGTLSALTDDGWPVSIGVRFAVDGYDGTPILCFSNTHNHLSIRRDGTRSSFHVQLEQSGGVRTPQCTIQGTLIKPQQQHDSLLLKKLHLIWEKKFGEALNEDFIYTVSVDRVIQMDDFMEDGVLVTSSDYKTANPDPLRDFAERIVDEINTHNKEDVHRFCNIYVDMDFMVKEAKLVWVDRLGFDMRLSSIGNDIFEVRIPFPREVTDEKGVKSSFNGMSQLAWEVEKNYYAPDFNKVKQLKKISSRGD